MLGLYNSNETTVKLHLALGVPIYTTDAELTTSDNQSTYVADIDLSIITPMDLEIAGILRSDYNNTYSDSGNSVIYMPIDMMNQIMESAANSFNKTTVNENFTLNEWMPSAYVVFVKDYNDVSITIEKLQSINPNFRAVNTYQDVESMNKILFSVRSTATWIIAIVLCIIIVLMAVIYINHTVNRKYEVAILKSNGLNKNEVFKLVLAEALLQVFIILMLAILFSILIANVVNLLFSFQIIKIAFPVIITIALIAIFAVIAPTTGSIIVMNRVKPDKIMRN